MTGEKVKLKIHLSIYNITEESALTVCFQQYLMFSSYLYMSSRSTSVIPIFFYISINQFTLS